MLSDARSSLERDLRKIILLLGHTETYPQDCWDRASDELARVIESRSPAKKSCLRDLSSDEQEFIRLVADIRGIVFQAQRVAFRHRGNFTLCILKAGNSVTFGVTKRMSTDKDNRVFARKIALARAVEGVPMEL